MKNKIYDDRNDERRQMTKQKEKQDETLCCSISRKLLRIFAQGRNDCEGF